MQSLIFVCMAVAGAANAGAADDELVRASKRYNVVDAQRFELFGLQWRRPVVRTGHFRSVGTTLGGPALSRAHDLVIAGTGEGEVRALHLKDGQIAWRYNYGESFQATAAIVSGVGDKEADELVVLGSRDGTLLALDTATGKLRWEAKVAGDPRAPVTQAGERLLVATSANKVYALDIATGAELWTKGRDPPPGLTITGVARAVEQGGTVFATFSDGYAEAYRLEDGSTVWSRALSGSGKEFIDADADPLFADGVLYVASYSDGVYALRPDDGQTIWQRPAPAVTSLGRYEGLIIAASADGYLWGLSSRDGRLLYRTRTAPGAMSRMVVRDGIAVLTSGPNGLLVLDAGTGKPLQASAIGATAAGDPAWLGSSLAVLSTNGYLFAMRLPEQRGR